LLYCICPNAGFSLPFTSRFPLIFNFSFVQFLYVCQLHAHARPQGAAKNLEDEKEGVSAIGSERGRPQAAQDGVGHHHHVVEVDAVPVEKRVPQQLVRGPTSHQPPIVEDIPLKTIFIYIRVVYSFGHYGNIHTYIHTYIHR